MKTRMAFQKQTALLLGFAFLLAVSVVLGINQGVSADAKTSIVSMNVTYKVGDGPAVSDVKLEKETDTFNFGANTLAKAPTCSNSNYTFVRWVDGDGNVYLAGDTYDNKGTGSSITFTAVWGVKVTYNINLDDSTEKVTAPESATAVYKEAFKIPDTATLTATNYTFLGWATAADATAAQYKVGESVKADQVSGPLTLYAVWKAKFFSVVYHANTDSDANDVAVSVPVDATKYMDDNLTVTVMGNGKLASTNANYATMTDATPARNGYTFAGWATSATATTAQYQPGTTFTVAANTDLYAVWTAGSTTGSGSSTTTPQTGDSDHFLLYIILAGLCLAGIGYLCYDQRKAKVTK